MRALKRLWPYLRGQRAILLAAYACMLLLGASSAFYAFLAGPALKFVFTGDFTDVLRSGSGQLRSVWQWLPDAWVHAVEQLDARWTILVVPLLIISTAVVKGLAQTGQFYLTGRISQNTLRAVRADAFDALLGQSAAFYERRAHGDLLSRLTHDAEYVERAVFYGCAPLLREPIAVLFLVGFCFFINAKLAFATFVVVPLAVFPLVRFAKWLKRVSRRGQDHQGTINAVTYEALAGISVVQAFGGEAHERGRLARAADAFRRQMLKSYFIRAVRTPTMEILGAVALATLLGAVGYYVRSAQADPAHFISFFVAIMLMYDPLKKLGNVSDHLASGASALDRIGEIIDAPRTVQSKPGAVSLPPFREAVRFEQVWFDYGDGPVLRGVDLTLRAGQVVALVGPSGAGKSSLAKLLPRFYDVTGGRISIDGRDIRDVTLASLRAQISVVSQETFLFNATIRENIAYARPEATDAEIRAAAEAAQAAGFISELPGGYDTHIGERGLTLSGGQRQRLAIARALLRDAPLLVLDEATSALDVESEREVQRALETLMSNRTSLVIAHRLSTIRQADAIAVLKGGRIIELGQHTEMLAAEGEYARLYNLQFAQPASAEVAR